MDVDGADKADGTDADYTSGSEAYTPARIAGHVIFTYSIFITIILSK